MKAYLNADIYAAGVVQADHALIVDEGIVQSIVARTDVPASAERIDLRGENLAAGFVDLQVNGGGGVFFNVEYAAEDVRRAIHAHRRLGTTSIFPTVFTSSQEAMSGLLDTVLRLRRDGETGIAGIHFEGPVIEAARAGVHDKGHIRALDDAMIHFFKRSASLLPTLVTLAPEHVTDSQIAELRAAGVLIFAGHTNADYGRMKSAFAAGLQGGTHLFNAMGAFGSREPGTVGALLAQDDAYASIIADGHHVHWASLKVAWRAKRLGRVICVTDAMPCVGSSVDHFRIGELQVHVRNGRCETEDGTLAGSALDMATAVRNLVQKVGISLPESLRMANSYPANFAGLERIGDLKPGMAADFVVFDNQLHISDVYVGGVSAM